jgi:hypothetical protein
VKDALEQARVDYSAYIPWLKRLAVFATDSSNGWVRAADISPSESTWEPLLQVGLVVTKSRGILAFPLPILTEWFAAHSLADDPSLIKDYIQKPERLERWRYPLAIAVATFSHDIVTALLQPIAEKYPTFAVEVVREGSSRWGDSETPAGSILESSFGSYCLWKNR